MSTSLDSQPGQLFILELQSAKWSARVESLLRSIQPAGVVVPLDTVRTESYLRDTAKGISSVLKGAPMVGLAGPHTSAIESVLSATSDGASPIFDSELKRRAEASGKWLGMVLRAFGHNVDFSLWLDLANPGPRLALGTRTPDRDPQLVAKCAGAYIRGLRTKHVVACARDFPGIGSVELDQEFGGLLSSKSMAALWQEDLVPYRKLLSQLPLVMISHAAYKAYDFDVPRPAVWSYEVVTGLLRVKLGYKGVAVADLSKLAWAPSDTDIGKAAFKDRKSVV